jgi:hypothetical protein
MRPETSTQKKLRQKNYEEGGKLTEANTRKPQPRNRREKREQARGERELDRGRGLEKVGCQTARAAA